MRYKKIIFILASILIAALSGQAFSATYTYDNLNRLISIDYGNGTVANYTYDPAGNTISLSVTTPLSGSVTINGGATSTTSPSVTLTLSATDTLSSVSQMRFSNDNTTWSTWETFATTKAWTLTSGNGTKTVYFEFNDTAGRVSQVFFAAITLNTVIDLTVSSISAPASAPQGGSIAVPNTVSNIGTAASVASTTNFYLSTTTSVNQNSVLLGQRSVGPIAAGGGDTASTTLTIPASTPTNVMYYIVAVADATNTNQESNENNNTGASAAMSVTTGIDLTVSSISAPASVQGGSSISVPNTVSNIGTSSAILSSATYFFLSSQPGRVGSAHHLSFVGNGT